MNGNHDTDTGVVIEGTLTDLQQAMRAAKIDLVDAEIIFTEKKEEYLNALALKREKITNLHRDQKFLSCPIVDACILFLGADIHAISKLQNFNRTLQESRDEYIAILMHKIVPELDHEELHLGIALAKITNGDIEVIENRTATINHVMSHSKNILEDVGTILLPTEKYFANFLNQKIQTGKIGSYSEDDIDALEDSDGPLFNISDEIKKYFGFKTKHFNDPVVIIGGKDKIIFHLTEALGKLMIKYKEAEIKGDTNLPDSVFASIS